MAGCLPCWRSRSADAHDTREKRAAENRAAGTLQKEVMCRTSLVVQRWRLNISNVGAQFPSLVKELDPACHN